MFKVSKKALEQNIFKVKNKHLRMVSGASIINFEHISNFTDIIVEQINAVWT